ncbi:hypothetical protein SAMN05216337_108218 [Bradyrhizobium brasilense]|uniref:Uncharacterized protein n=1 Tax=Bradyrhizobium brasilense TaxID=1419277 RepID=A0A1G7PP79_9BRAD|nr:hypothetical protein SAMN05216337_108218 [Bradyrhizobium brasilense]
MHGTVSYNLTWKSRLMSDEGSVRLAMLSDAQTRQALRTEEALSQTKYQYMSDRTFLQPRDMIKFCNETSAAQSDRMARIGQRMTGRRFNAFAVPAIAKAENAFIVGHKINLEVAKPHPANHIVLWRFRESLLPQLLLQLRPLRMPDKINDQIHIVGCPHAFERNLIGNEQCCRASADKDQPPAQVVAQRLGDGFQHHKELALNAGHFSKASLKCARRPPRFLADFQSEWHQQGPDIHTDARLSGRLRGHS